jgi:hypothetical protein
MPQIKLKDVEEIISKRLFHAGLELLHMALDKQGITGKEIDSEDAMTVLELLKEGMHTDISKSAVEKCIQDLGHLIAKLN